MLGVLVLGFGGAGMTGACGSNEPGPVEACPAPPDTPPDTSTECAEPMPDACMRYRIPLVGNPSTDVALRSKYIGAFGSACYLKDPKGTPENDPDRAQVHHVVPRKDLRGCPWGTNVYKNAAVISRRLNRFLYYNVPPEKEVLQINNVPPYTP